MKDELLTSDGKLEHLNFSIPGLSICKQTGELFFPTPEAEKSTTYLTRTLSEMRDVLFDTAVLENSTISPNQIVHRIYRTINDTEEIIEADLKYDITVILPGEWGMQLPTTTGHFHLPVEGSDSPSPSPDLYQLISGDILAVLQKDTEKGTEVFILHPKIGGWVLIPGEYAHSVVNRGSEPAVFANICVRTPHLTYEPILKRRGMGVYVLSEKSDETIQIVRNPNYKKIYSVSMAMSLPTIPNLQPLIHTQSLFEVLNSKLHNLKFLTDPDSEPNIFKPDPIQVI